ncbi:MAG: DUF1648 domain-containing protein [Candidatus Kapaibacterium sp.]|jgi:uncharacterized membrane protein|nr:DUF1648 domain-containing protein [Candidatus Kapabacteria bacterium]
MSRPKPENAFTFSDKILDFTSLIIIAVNIIFTAYHYSGLPEIIPTHFDLKGNPDGYNNKITVWLLPVISLVMYIGLVYLNKIPHHFNYLVKISSENAQVQYKLAQSLVRQLNLIICLTFLIINYYSIESANNNVSGDFALMLIYLPITLFFVLVRYLYVSSKKR